MELCRSTETLHLEFEDGGGGSRAVKPQNWLTEAGAHLQLERACSAVVCQRLSTASASSVRESKVHAQVRVQVVMVMAELRVY